MTWSRTGALATLVCVWCLIASLAALWAAHTRPVDPTPRLIAEFRALSSALPPEGTIGFLGPATSAFPPSRYTLPTQYESLRTQYAAEFALTPRVLTTRAGTEFLIVAATVAGNAPQLDDYELVLRSPAGHTVYRVTAR